MIKKNILIKKIERKSFKEFLFEKWLKGFIYSVNKKNNKLRNHKMAVFANDQVSTHINLYGIYEKREIEMIIDLCKRLKLINKKSVAIDIGANIGNHSIEFSKFFDHVKAFEANPDTFEILKFNTKNFDNIRIFNFGLGKDDCIMNMIETKNNIGQSKVIKNPNTEDIVFSIKIKKLDDILNTDKNINLIKIDVEGMEYDVLLGSEQLIKRNKPIIAFEQNIDAFDKKGESNSINFLKKNGYEIFWWETQKSELKWLYRRLINIFEIIKGRKEIWELKTGNKIPIQDHPIIIGIHNSYLENL
tara:strand:- start:264 stop:1169 length:906 start_codon:yes stop_codon:yes gene_type:complete